MRCLVVAVATIASLSCGGSARTAPASPSPIRTTPGDSGVAPDVGQAATSLAALSVGFDSGQAVKSVAFPPLNEPLAFRQQLEAVYQTQLGGKPTTTFVDFEGSVVWMQEYLRYVLSGCDHFRSRDMVMSEIDGAKPPLDCGGSVAFPDRLNPVLFRKDLEGKYATGLRRSPSATFVDLEGDAVWITEYLRYRVSGCTHAIATDLVIRQINHAPPTSGCGTEFSGYVHEESDRDARVAPVCLPEARVEAVEGPQAGLALVTDRQGRFLFRNSQPSMLSVTRPGYFPGRFPIATGGSSIVIALRPTARIVEQTWDDTLQPDVSPDVCRRSLFFDIGTEGILVIKEITTGIYHPGAVIRRGDGSFPQPVCSDNRIYPVAPDHYEMQVIGVCALPRAFHVVLTRPE